MTQDETQRLTAFLKTFKMEDTDSPAGFAMVASFGNGCSYVVKPVDGPMENGLGVDISYDAGTGSSLEVFCTILLQCCMSCLIRNAQMEAYRHYEVMAQLTHATATHNPNSKWASH